MIRGIPHRYRLRPTTQADSGDGFLIDSTDEDQETLTESEALDLDAAELANLTELENNTFYMCRVTVLDTATAQEKYNAQGFGGKECWKILSEYNPNLTESYYMEFVEDGVITKGFYRPFFIKHQISSGGHFNHTMVMVEKVPYKD